MSADATFRPRDFALLLLASRDLRPRQRARDQQADRAGLDLKRRMLDDLAGLDPEPAELEATLLRIALRADPPSGPARRSQASSSRNGRWRVPGPTGSAALAEPPRKKSEGAPRA
jgi:hypothetical protein